MSLAGAVRAMRRSLAAYVQPDVCPTCGPPASSTRIVEPGTPLDLCATCGGPVDAQGRALGHPTPRGTYVLTLTTDDVREPYVP